ncbi:MAG: EamA family transporter [Tetrasphaera sp.]
MTSDSPIAVEKATHPGLGLSLALASAMAFALSGPLAKPLFGAGWNAGSVVLVRIGLAAALVAPFGIRALGGRWWLLRRNARVIVLYGILAVAGAQFCYFSAVERMAVGPALLIEYTAPAGVVVWLWLRHGQRPGRLTVLGAVLAAAGLVLVLDLLSGAPVSISGVLWALGAMVGAASYFVISADTDNGLPPLTLAAAGLAVGGLFLGLFALIGALPVHFATHTATYAASELPFWLPLLALGLVTAALSYSLGIAATRHLGSRLASFVALTEVLFAVLFAWLLLDELPRVVQLAGGILVLAGVVAVKLGETQVARGDGHLLGTDQDQG